MSKIKIMALGGLGENGKNMYVVEVDEHIFILDAGMKFPDIDLYGVDLVIPKLDYLYDKKDKIEGIFLSHGHTDNSAAVPYFLKNLPTRVYGSHFTISVLESMLEGHGLNIKDYKLFRVNANKVMKFGNVSVTFFNTTHSIPESMGICLKTDDGAIVYCTDFNFGVSGDGTYKTTFDKITDIGKTKVLALLSESISSGLINRINNDSLLEKNFKEIVNQKYDRIFVGAFSSDLIRIQTIINYAVRENLKIGLKSVTAHGIIQVAMDTGYLHIPEELFINLDNMSIDEIKDLKNVLIFITGSRTEPYKTLVKMSSGDDDLIKFTEKDKVILMCPPTSGTEKITADSINLMYYYNANLTVFDKDVLKSAHASPEDLKLLYAMLKPEYLIPIKGEYRHIYQQMNCALNAGFARDHILLLDNGEQVSFIDGILQEEHQQVPSGDVYIDGTSVGVVDADVLSERNRLAEDGIIYVYGVVDLRKRALNGNISIKTKGFTSTITDEELTNSLGGLMEKMTNNALTKKTWSKEQLISSLTKELENVVYRYTKHRPVIVPIIYELK